MDDGAEDRLSGFASIDVFRNRAPCAPDHCHGVGLAMNEDGTGYKAVGWDGDTQLFEECSFRGGTGVLAQKPSI